MMESRTQRCAISPPLDFLLAVTPSPLPLLLPLMASFLWLPVTPGPPRIILYLFISCLNVVLSSVTHADEIKRCRFVLFILPIIHLLLFLIKLN